MTQISKTAETFAFVKEPKVKDSAKSEQTPSDSFDSVLSKTQQPGGKPVQKDQSADPSKPEAKSAKEQEGDKSGEPKDTDKQASKELQLNPLLCMLLQVQAPVQQETPVPVAVNTAVAQRTDAAADAAQNTQVSTASAPLQVLTTPPSTQPQAVLAQPQTADAVTPQTLPAAQMQVQPQTAQPSNAEPAVQKAEGVNPADPKQQTGTDPFTSVLQGADVQLTVSQPTAAQTPAVQNVKQSESQATPIQSTGTQQPVQAQNPAVQAAAFTGGTDAANSEAANQHSTADSNEHPVLKTEKTEGSNSTVKTETSAGDFRQSLTASSSVSDPRETHAADSLGQSQTLQTQQQPASAQISHKVLTSIDQGNYSFQMKLKPDGLGEVTVHMQCDNGKLSLAIQTGVESTHKLLLSQIDNLRSELGSGGYQLQNVSVTGVKENTASNSSFLFSGGMDSGSGQNRYQNARQQQASYYGYNADVEPSAQIPAYYSGKLNYSV